MTTRYEIKAIKEQLTIKWQPGPKESEINQREQGEREQPQGTPPLPRAAEPSRSARP